MITVRVGRRGLHALKFSRRLNDEKGCVPGYNANRRRVNRLRQTRSGRGVLFNLAQVFSPSRERARPLSCREVRSARVVYESSHVRVHTQTHREIGASNVLMIEKRD